MVGWRKFHHLAALNDRSIECHKVDLPIAKSYVLSRRGTIGSTNATSPTENAAMRWFPSEIGHLCHQLGWSGLSSLGTKSRIMTTARSSSPLKTNLVAVPR